MSPRSIRTLWLLISLSGLGCGEDSEATTPVEVSEASEYLEAIPTADELSLALTDADGQALTAAEFALEGEGAPARVREITLAVFERVNAIIDRTQARILAEIKDVEPEELELGGFTCKRWLKTIEGVEWRLRACRRDRALRLYGFLLEGRAEGGAEADYAPVFAGEGVIRPRFDGQKRGVGRIGYDLDNLNALTGQGATGKLGIGYRAVGRVRQLNVGLKGFAPEGDTPTDALYRYRQLIGLGGKVRLVARADLLAEDENGALVQGEDGLIERSRISLGWLRGKGGRAALLHCDGTVGEGQCVRRSQCWREAGLLTHDAEGRPDDAPDFAAARCPLADIDPIEEESLPDLTDEALLGAPAIDEPNADPEEEA